MASTDPRLPEEIPPHATVREIVLSVGLAVLVVAALNAMMALHLANSEIDLVSTKWDRLAHHDADVDWLFLGDSSCNQGLDPKVWAEVGGGSSLNLCTVAYVTLANATWMLEDWTARHSAPRGVIVVNTVDTWARQFETSELISYPFDWGFWEHRTPPLTLTLGQQRDLLLLRFVPMLSRSGRLSNLADLRAKDEEDEQRERALNPGVFVRPDGFMPWPVPDPAGVVKDAREITAYLKENPYELSDINRAALDELGSFADEHNIAVYMVHAPIYRAVADSDVYRGYKRSIDETLHDFAAKHPSVHVVDELYSTDADHLVIIDHITSEGAVDYTKWVHDRLE